MRCPSCGHDTLIGASAHVPADLDCLHCGRQLVLGDVEVRVGPTAAPPADEPDPIPETNASGETRRHARSR